MEPSLSIFAKGGKIALAYYEQMPEAKRLVLVPGEAGKI